MRELQPGETGGVPARRAVAGLAGIAFVVVSAWAALGALESTTELAWLAGANALLALVVAGLVSGGRRRPALLALVVYGAAAARLVMRLEETGAGTVSWLWVPAAAAGLLMVLAARGRGR